VTAEDFSLDGIAGNETSLPPEVELARAVLWRAWSDAFIDSDSASTNIDRKCDPNIERHNARRFLTLNFGQWQEDRLFWCDLADVSEYQLRMAAKRRIELSRAEDDAREAESRRRARVRVDSLFAKLLADSDDLHPGRLDQRLHTLAEIELETL